MIKRINSIVAIALITLMMAYAFLCVNSSHSRSYTFRGISLPIMANKMFYYQSAFAPAVGYACGNSFKPYSANRADHPYIYSFLQGKIDSVDCAKANLKMPISRYAAGIGLYLIKSVGLWWKVFGVSWKSASNYFCIVFCLTLILLFFTYKSVTSNVIASIATLITGHVYLKQLMVGPRDFMVAFFFCAIFLVGLNLVTKPSSIIKVFCAVFLAGVICGIGIGFRSDVLAVSLLFACALPLIYFSSASLSRHMQIICASLILFSLTVSFFYSFIPVEYNTFHVLIEGFGDMYTAALGLKNHLYTAMPYYDDSYINSIVNDFTRSQGYGVHVLYDSPMYFTHTMKYYLDMFRLLPADFLIRVLASIKALLGASIKALLGGGALGRSHWDVTSFCALSLFSALARNIRNGLFLILFICGACAYSFLQFSFRHYFYTSAFCEIFLLLYLLKMLVEIIFKYRKSDGSIRRVIVSHFPDIKIASCIAAIGCTIVFLLLVYSRISQNHSVKNLIGRLVSSPRINADVKLKVVKEGEFFQVPALNSAGSTVYYALTFKSAKPLFSVNLRLYYSNDKIDTPMNLDWSSSDLTMTYSPIIYSGNYNLNINVTVAKQVTLFIPIYPHLNGTMSFRGFVVRKDSVKDHVSIQKIKNPEKFPVKLLIAVPNDWKSRNYYQTM